MKTHIIWDMDGTLVDSGEDITRNVFLAVEDAGLPLSCIVKPIRVGPPIDLMLKESIPAEVLTDKKLTEITACFRRRYDNSDFTATRPFAGIDKILRDAKAYSHHIVTNKPDLPAAKIVAKSGWDNIFLSLTTPYSGIARSGSQNTASGASELLSKRKTKTELFAGLMDKYGKENKFIAVGDTKTDGIAAKANNILSLGVLWGVGTREELSVCCDRLFENTGQLYAFLCEDVTSAP